MRSCCEEIVRKTKSTVSLSSKLELKGLVKSDTAPSTCSTLHLSIFNISFQCIEQFLSIY